MTTNTTTTTTITTTTTDDATNTTATTMTTTDTDTDTTHKETLTDSKLNNSKTTTNNNDNNNVNQNVENVLKKSPNLLMETEVEKSPSWELKNSKSENPAENELNLIENKYQSLTKINSSILGRQVKDNNNLVSLELDLGNNLDFKQPEDKEKLINLEESVKEETTTPNLNEQNSLIDCFLDSESYKLLQKLPINNPFYRFHKQSNSFREIHMKNTSWDFLIYSTRKFKSDTDLLQNNNLIINNPDDKTTTAATTINEHKNIFISNNTSNKQNNIVVVADQSKNNNNSNNCNKMTTLTRNQKLDIKFGRQQFNRLQQTGQQQQQQSLSNSGLPAHSVNALIMIKPNDFNNSTVITNPFSIFHDDETHLTLTVDKRLRCASSASRKLLRKPVTATSTSSNSSGGSVTLQTPKPFTSQQHLNNYHYLYGVPIKKFERQDFPPPTAGRGAKNSKLPTSSSSSSVFKQISLRKMPKAASASSSNIHVPLTGPQLKRLKITYPNLTQPLATTTAAHHKNTYFSRLQAKTRQGLQKLKDKCKQFNYHTSQRTHLGRLQHTSSFKTMSKVESFRFISDRDNIRNYETRCMAAYHQDHKKHPGTLYKSYKSELDLSKNLNYLEAYLNQNFEQQNSAQSVGRHQGQKIRRAFHHMTESTNLKHKRSNSHSSAEGHHVSPKKLNLCKNNYENVQNLPSTKSESLSSSDYASVFSATCGEDNLSQHKTDKTDLSSHNNLRYEHPKMSEFNKLKQAKLHSDLDQTRQQSHPPQRPPLNEEDREVEENELVFKQELLSICQNKDNIYFQNDFPLDIPEDEEDELACNNIRILINNSEDFERSPDDDWYVQRSENANLTEVAFYRSLNEQLQQEDLYDDRSINYDPFMPHLNNDLYNFDTETEDEKQLISSTSSLPRCQPQNLSDSYKYDYSNSLNEKSLHLPDYKTAEENAQLMQSLYKTYQAQSLAKQTALSSSSSTSSIHQQQAHTHAHAHAQALPTQNSTKYKHNKMSNPLTPLSYNSNNHTASLTGNQRNSSSSTDTYDNFVATRSYPQKIPSKRSSFSQYSQRSPIQPQMNALNYYGVSTSNDTYSIPFKLQSSSSSSNHSSKLSNSSSNSTTSSNHTNPLIMPSNHMANSLTSAAATATAASSSPATQISLTKLYNNQNNTASTAIIANATTQPAASPALLYHQEKRDKFILEYKC